MGVNYQAQLGYGILVVKVEDTEEVDRFDTITGIPYKKTISKSKTFVKRTGREVFFSDDDSDVCDDELGLHSIDHNMYLWGGIGSVAEAHGYQNEPPYTEIPDVDLLFQSKVKNYLRVHIESQTDGAYSLPDPATFLIQNCSY